MKTYLIWWTDIEGNVGVECFAPTSSPLMSTLEIRRCKNPRKQAHAFCRLLTKYGLKINQIVSGYERGIL